MVRRIPHLPPSYVRSTSPPTATQYADDGHVTERGTNTGSIRLGVDQWLAAAIPGPIMRTAIAETSARSNQRLQRRAVMGQPQATALCAMPPWRTAPRRC